MIDGLNITLPIWQSDGVSFHGLELKKPVVDSVVMSLSDKITGDVYYRDSNLVFTMREYVTYNDVNYYLVNPPTVVREGLVKDNSDLNGMTKYSLEFYHPMYILSNMPFTDVAVSYDEIRYKSQDKTFSWIGKPADFVAKLNKNLDGTEWVVVLSDRFPQDKVDELSEVLSFDNATIGEVLKTGYETWNVPYVVDKLYKFEYYHTDANHNNTDYYDEGKRFVVLFGLPSNEIYEHEGDDEPFVFKFGQGLGLKNNSRNPRNNKIITRIAGYGSENNIPYGYPQIRWYGDPNAKFTYGDRVGVHENVTINGEFYEKVVSYPIYEGIVGGEWVKLIKHPFTRNHLMPSVYYDTVFNKVSFYYPPGVFNQDYDPDIEIIDYYDAVENDDGYDYKNLINPSAPSYEIHEFSDIKPELGEEQILGATPIDAQLNEVEQWDDTMDDNGNYLQSYFKLRLPKLGFDIYACAAITQEMQINMRSGACIGCTFTVQVDWEDYKLNFYDSEMNFAPKGEQRNYERYPDSSEGEISVIVQKDNNTFGTLMPNIYQKPMSGDFFVVLGISLPLEYIFRSERRLDDAMKSYMLENNVYYFDYPLKFDECFLRNNVYALNQIRPNSIIRFEYNGKPLELFVKQLTIKYGADVLPQYDITLTDNVDVVLNAIGQVADDVQHIGSLVSLLRQSYSKSVWVEIANKLSRIDDDTANGLITFLKGLRTGKFIHGWIGSGANIDASGNSEFESVYVRGAIRAAELVFNRIRAEEGEAIRSIGHGEILTVDEESQIATLKLEGDEWATIAEGDICRGLYNTVAKDFDNAGNEGQDNNGFRLESGFFASYFKVEQILTNNKGECSFRYSLQTDDQGNVVTEHPCPLMKFAVYGNTDDTKKERQSSMYITAVGIAPRVLFLTGVNYWQIKPWNIKVAIGNIEGIEAYEKTSDGAIQPVTLHGDAGLFVEDNIYFGGVIEQFVAAHLDEILDELNGGIHAELLRGSDNIIVDALGNIVNGIYVQNGETKRYKLHTGVLVYDSRKKMYLVAKADDDETDIKENEFRISYTCNGCDVLRDGADFYITNIHNTNDGISETVLTDEELALMRETHECSINFVITTANEWRTMMSYPVKITHLDYSYITFDLTNDYDSMSYRTQTKRYEGLPISTTVKAHINGEEVAVQSVTVTSDLFSGSMTSAFGLEVTKRLSCGLTIMLNGATLTIDHSNTTGAETDLPDFKHWFDISSVVKYAGINYESGNMRFTLQETTDATLYKLLVSSNAISKDEGSYTPSTIDVKLQIIGDSGTVVKTESEVNNDSSMKVKIRYINGVYDPNGTNTLLTTCPQFNDVSTCFNVLAVDDSNANAPIVYDVQSVTINAKGRDGAGQPYVDSNIDSYSINCNSSGVPLRSHNINIVCSLYWGSDKCVIDSGSYIKYKGNSLALTNDTTANTVSASLYIRNSGTLESSNIEVYLTGREVNDSTKTHSAQKTIAVNAVWAGTDGTDGNDGIGISSIVTYYLITDLYEGVTSQTEQNNWVDEYIDPTVDKPYLWRYTKYTYTDGGTDETPCELVGMYQNKSNPNLLGDTEFLNNSRLDSWYKHGEVHGNEDPEVSQFGIASTYTSNLGHNQFKGAYQASVSGGYINFLHQLVYGGDGVRKVEAGSWYTLSFHVYGIKTEIDGVVDDGAFQLDLNLTGLADTDNIYFNGTKVSSNGVIHIALGGNAFQRHVVTFQSKAVLTGNLYIKWDMYTRLYKQEIWLAMPKLEVGKIATPYSPMPAVKEPMARIVEWEAGQTFYQGANGEPYFDMCTYGRRYYKCLRTHVSSNTNKPDESGDTAYWSKANNFRFVATELLLADTGVINLLFSQKLYMRNALGQLAASLNDDGRGSYCMYYPDSGNKMFEVSADGYIYYYNDNPSNSVEWKLGHGGSILNSQSDDWKPIYLHLLSTQELNSFNGDTTFSRTEYYQFFNGTNDSFPDAEKKIFTGKPNNNNPYNPEPSTIVAISDGLYTPNSKPMHKIDDDGEKMKYSIVVYQITGGKIDSEYVRVLYDGNYYDEPY